MPEYTALASSSMLTTATTAVMAQRLRAVASQYSVGTAASIATASRMNRYGVPPARSGTPSSNATPAASRRRAWDSDIGRSRSPWSPIAPRTGIAIIDRYRMRPGLCRYTSPNGTLRRSVWNQPAVTITFNMRSHVSTRHPPNATTSARRARSRHANTTASSITAPTYAPGAEPNASGQAAQTPFVASGRSVTCAVERTGCPSASYPRCRLDEPMNARRGIRIARLARGIAIRNRPVRPAAVHPATSPPRTDATDVATRNAASSSEHITSPWLMWALATCDHAKADRASHARRRDHRSAWR